MPEYKKFNWPDRVISAEESAQIREEHNATVEALWAALDACHWVIDNWDSGDMSEAARACQDVIDFYEYEDEEEEDTEADSQ